LAPHRINKFGDLEQQKFRKSNWRSRFSNRLPKSAQAESYDLNCRIRLFLTALGVFEIGRTTFLKEIAALQKQWKIILFREVCRMSMNRAETLYN
jgi:hypothetical protein